MDHDKRITPDNIIDIKDNEVFVFGSNLGGFHSKGAAKTALTWGAKWRQAAGLQGRTYGIPTKDRTVKRVLSVIEIKPYVDEFIQFAINNPNLIFFCTEIGCGLSRYKPKDIAPLFIDAINIENIHLPRRFWRILVK